MDALDAAPVPTVAICTCHLCAGTAPPPSPRILGTVGAVSVLEDWTVQPLALDSVLSPNERRLLRPLVLHHPYIVSFQALGYAICARGDAEQVHNTVAVQIGRLRKKLIPHGLNPRGIDGLGYRLQAADTAPPSPQASHAA